MQIPISMSYFGTRMAEPVDNYRTSIRPAAVVLDATPP